MQLQKLHVEESVNMCVKFGAGSCRVAVMYACGGSVVMGVHS